MQKNKRDIKLRRLVIVFFIILVALLLISIVSVNKLKKEQQENKDELVLTDTVYINNEDEKIYPQNSFQLVYTYSGEQKLTDDFYKKIYFFERYLHKLSEENLDDNQISKYFDENSYTIEKKTGITELSNFVKIIDCVKKLNNNSLEFQKSIFRVDEEKIENNYTICPLVFQYSDGSELEFDLGISNSDSNEPLLKFIPR